MSVLNPNEFTVRTAGRLTGIGPSGILSAIGKKKGRKGGLRATRRGTGRGGWKIAPDDLIKFYERMDPTEHGRSIFKMKVMAHKERLEHQAERERLREDRLKLKSFTG